MELSIFLILALFALGYVAIILEHYLNVNKTAVALFAATTCWTVYFLYSGFPLQNDLVNFGHHVSDVAQIVFFLMGAMVIVELIDSHRGFRMITTLIQTSSKRKMLWLIALIAFFLSSVLDNLTTAILMVSLLRKLIPEKEDRFLLSCIVIVAANAGGAWTPIGDVTTTMLWINGQLSSLNVMKALFLPSLISLLIPLLIYTFQVKGRYVGLVGRKEEIEEPGGKAVFFLGVGALVFVPIFKAWTGLPPFMGILIGLSILWLFTDILHYPHEQQRSHLRVPYILTRIDTSGVLFFLGILLAVDALQTAGILSQTAVWLGAHITSLPVLATFIGLISAIIDNVPLVAATMGMYNLSEFPMDHTLWHMIAYAAGTGGSILIIGSAAGVALMGLEKIHFIPYLKKAAFPTLLGYLGGMGCYLLLV